MERLPPTSAAGLATKHDVAQSTEAIIARIDALDVRIAGRFDRLENRCRTLASELQLSTEFAGLHADIADFRADIRRTVRMHTILTIGVLGPYIALVGVLTGGG